MQEFTGAGMSRFDLNLPFALKIRAQEILAKEGISFASYLRLSLVHLVREEKVVFEGDKHSGDMFAGRPRKQVSETA